MGVPGTGAEIFMDYHLTLGARTGRMLPTERAVDWLALEDGTNLEITLCERRQSLCVLPRAGYRAERQRAARSYQRRPEHFVAPARNPRQGGGAAGFLQQLGRGRNHRARRARWW
jgi:hypothetical protein